MAKHPKHQHTLLTNALTATKRAMLYVFLFSFAVNVLSLLQPLYSMQVFDRVFNTRSVDTLVALTSVVVIGYAFYGLLYAVRAGVVARIVEWLERSVAPQLLRVSIEQAAQTGSPLAGQYQRDLMTLKNFISTATPTAMDIPWSLIFVLVVYMINPLLGFIVVGSIVILCIGALINEYATRKALLRASEKSVEVSLNADAIGRSAEAICAMGMNDAVIANWQEEATRGLALQDLAQQRSAIINGVIRSLRMLMQVSITAFGAWLALHNELSSGGLIASSILGARALQPFDQAINLWKQLIGARDAYHRLHTLLTTVKVPEGSTQLPTPEGRLRLEGAYVSFGKTTVLRNISFELNPGEILGIIGPSAAGKSTLAKTIAGVYAPVMGSVRLDGGEIFSWGRAEIGPHIGYLPQQVELFSGSIKRNISRLKDAPDAMVIEAAQKAGVHQLVQLFETGYDTVYVPGNTVLSPGQKQRIGLARAMFGNPRLVILDEPYSNLDGEGEMALKRAMEILKQQGITTIIVAHRPSALTSVDKILMLRNGVVEAFGPRDEILRRFAAPAQPTHGGGNA